MSAAAQLELPMVDPGAPPENVLRYARNDKWGNRAGDPRRCIDCGRWLLPADAEETSTAAPAVRNRSKPGGVGSICKPCDAAHSLAYAAANQEAVHARRRARYAENQEVERARARARAQTLAGRTDAEVAAARARLRPAGTKRCRGCREVKPLSAFSTDRTKADGLQTKCRACDSGGLRNLAAAYWSSIGVLEWLADRCYICGGDLGDDWHVEHVIPLSRGGADDVRNLAPACSTCNLSKGPRNLADTLVSCRPGWQSAGPSDPDYDLLQVLASGAPPAEVAAVLAGLVRAHLAAVGPRWVDAAPGSPLYALGQALTTGASPADVGVAAARLLLARLSEAGW